MISDQLLLKGLNALASAAGREVDAILLETYASALSELTDAEFTSAVVALAKNWTENRIPPPAKIIEAGKGRTATQGRVEADAQSAEIFKRLMWAYDDCVDGQYSYSDQLLLRKFGARVLVAFRAIGGGSKLDLARYNDEERKWALKEFQDAMRGIADDRGAQAALASWTADRTSVVARQIAQEPTSIESALSKALR